MAKKGYIKRLLPGSNTSIGFYSYFEHIIDQKEAEKIYYFKGGPGVGKSYMMEKIGYKIIDKGLDIEFHHCAADPESIDAIVIPDIRVAIIDGTTPHMITILPCWLIATKDRYSRISGKNLYVNKLLFPGTVAS